MAMAESLDETMAALIERFTKFGQTKSAVFWAEKRLALCNGDGIAETVSYLQVKLLLLPLVGTCVYCVLFRQPDNGTDL
jgi:hypothetical protein